MENNHEKLYAKKITTIKIRDENNDIFIDVYKLNSGGYVGLNSSYTEIMIDTPIHSPYTGEEAEILA